MYQSLIVIDDFYPDPEQVRRTALDAYGPSSVAELLRQDGEFRLGSAPSFFWITFGPPFSGTNSNLGCSNVEVGAVNF